MKKLTGLSGPWHVDGPRIDVDADGTVRISMTAHGRPDAIGSVTGDETISVMFPDRDKPLSGTLATNPERIEWSDGTVWTRPGDYVTPVEDRPANSERRLRWLRVRFARHVANRAPELIDMVLLRELVAELEPLGTPIYCANGATSSRRSRTRSTLRRRATIFGGATSPISNSKKRGSDSDESTCPPCRTTHPSTNVSLLGSFRFEGRWPHSRRRRQTRGSK